MNKQVTPGILFIIAAPSGGGKTSLVNQLLKMDSHLKLSISHTTRPMRPGEIQGKHYFFVTPDFFNQMVERGEFLEHATVFSHSYGTSSQQVMHCLQEGLDVILEIDWQGAQQVRELFANVVSVFILPPSYEALEERLSQRGQDTEAIISARMKKAHGEISHCEEFDFVVFNDDFDVCLQQLQAIIMSQRLRYEQQSWRSAKRLEKLLKLNAC
jgi:guanylate kinase